MSVLNSSVVSAAITDGARLFQWARTQCEHGGIVLGKKNTSGHHRAGPRGVVYGRGGGTSSQRRETRSASRERGGGNMRGIFEPRAHWRVGPGPPPDFF